MGGSTLLYTYDPVKVHAVKTITINGVARSFDYDTNGNMTAGWDLANPLNPVQRTIVYNADNKPSQVTRGGQTTYFLYDGEGGRARKVGPGGTTYYVGEHFEIKSGEETKYIFAGNLRIAKVAPSGTYYYHKDHLGSTTAMTADDGQVVEGMNYDPFGSQRGKTGTVVSNYLYTDQEYDPETGLYYYGARYYDPVIGRFISPDSVVQDPYDPQSLNRYTYCSNNPLIYVDPSGHHPLLIAMAVGAVVGAISAGIQSDWNLEAMTQGFFVGAFSALAAKALFAGIGQLLTEVTSAGATSEASNSALGQLFADASAGGKRYLESIPWEGSGITATDAAPLTLSKVAGTSGQSYTAAQYAAAGVAGASGGVTGGMAAGSATASGSGANHVSHWLLRALVPGQVAWDNAVTAYVEGRYVDAGISTVEMVAEQVATVLGFRTISWGTATGYEYVIGKNWRFAPWGNRTGHPTGEWPHYHRRGAPDPITGKTPNGQGIGRHRPLDVSSHDKSFWDRF